MQIPLLGTCLCKLEGWQREDKGGKMERWASAGRFSYQCHPQSRSSSELSEGRRTKGKVTTTQPHWNKKEKNKEQNPTFGHIGLIWHWHVLWCLSSLRISLSHSCWGRRLWRITSASGSVFRHTRRAAELRLVVDVRLDRGWRERERSQRRKSEGDGDRWRERRRRQTDREAVIKSPCFFSPNN